MRQILLAVLTLCCLVPATACRRRAKPVAAPDYNRELPPGQDALIRLPEAEWPVVRLGGSVDQLRKAIDHSLRVLQAPSFDKSRRWRYPVSGITKAQVLGGLERLRALLVKPITDGELNRILRSEFDCYLSRGWDDQGTVLFTGYYTPIFEASPVRTARFRYPVYKRPADLKVVIDQATDEPVYPPAAELLSGNRLQGLEIYWLADPFDPYIIRIQGSAKLRLSDGRQVELGYDGCNGHPYQSLGLQLVAEGKIRKEDLSLAALRTYFRTHPEELDIYARRNPRFVFFKEAPGGPFGCLGAPVTTDITVATDKRIFPAGALSWVDTGLGNADSQPYAAFRVDQDAGGAIRAPGRCDLYMGEGQMAEDRAGRQYREGRLYYFVAKP